MIPTLRPVPLVASASGLLGGLVLTWVAAYGWHHLYGDGYAHLAIARKLVDALPDTSWWERYIQLGSPWLPLPHVLTAPLAVSDLLWRSGLAGSLVSLLAFVAAATFLFRLVTDLTASRTAAAVAWAAFALNPSLLYLQTTPLTEPLFLATWLGSAWSGYGWVLHGGRTKLVQFGLWTVLALLTRYEGWVLLPAGVGVVAWCSRRRGWARVADVALWSSLVGAGVVYWLWHNWAIYGRPLEFLNGLYSARGYFARHRDELSYLGFIVGRPLAAGLVWVVTVVICASVTTTLLGAIGWGLRAYEVWRMRSLAADIPTGVVCLWLWLPPLFTAYSLYSGNIQIYPLFLNNRYGLAALPALAVGIGLGVTVLQRRFPAQRRWSAVVVGLVCLGQSLWVLRDGVYQLSVFQEAYRAQFTPLGREQRALARFLRAQVGPSPVALFSGDLSSVIAQSGLTYAQLLHEGCAVWHTLDRAIPVTVVWLVVGRGDGLDAKLQRHPVGRERFSPVWVSDQGTFTVWRRNL